MTNWERIAFWHGVTVTASIAAIVISLVVILR